VPRPRSAQPSYRPHASGQARVTLDGVDHYLGPYDTPESRARYEQVLADWRAGRLDRAQPQPTAGPASALTVADLAAAWWRRCEVKYAASTELAQHATAVKVLLARHAGTPAAQFGPRALGEVLADFQARGWCRRVCNRHLVRLKTMLRWLGSQELVAGDRLHQLLVLPGLEPGEAPEHTAVAPVAEATVQATLGCLGRVVRGLLEFQLLTGCRPGEACRLRPCDLHRSGSVEVARGWDVPLGDVWAVRYDAHKTARKTRRPRIILVGPRAQAVLAPFLERSPAAYFFSPKEAAEEWLRERGRTVNHARARTPGTCYSVTSYDHAVVKACERAFGLPAELRAQGRRADRLAWRAGHCWHPHQLRHLAATRLVDQFGELGWELARVLLGHSAVATTRGYVLDTLKQAAQAVREVG
jgi:integrase